jgi:hypothetical protein
MALAHLPAGLSAHFDRKRGFRRTALNHQRITETRELGLIYVVNTDNVKVYEN